VYVLTALAWLVPHETAAISACLFEVRLLFVFVLFAWFLMYFINFVKII